MRQSEKLSNEKISKLKDDNDNLLNSYLLSVAQSKELVRDIINLNQNCSSRLIL